MKKAKKYVIFLEGKGSINKKEEIINFKQGDVIFIENK